METKICRFSPAYMDYKHICLIWRLVYQPSFGFPKENTPGRGHIALPAVFFEVQLDVVLVILDLGDLISWEEGSVECGWSDLVSII